MKEWFFIINPEAKSGQGKFIWPKIKQILNEKKVKYKSIFTKYPMESISIVSDAVREGWLNFVAVGGDGTINEVINGVFLQEFVEINNITFAMIPIGTGNDCGRGLGISTNYQSCIQTIINEKIIRHSVGVVKYNALNMSKNRFLINVAGFGFDASIVEEVNKTKEQKKGSKICYLQTIFKQIFKYKSTDTIVTIDENEVFNSSMYSMCVGVGKYNGGGLMQLPHAKFDNGKLAITIIAHLHPIKFIGCFPKLLMGNINKVKEVSIFEGQKVTITSNPPIGVEVDGEYLGVTKSEISLLDQKLNIVANP